MFEITKEYRFSAAHALPTLPKDHKCHRLHGHNYVVTFCFTSDKLDEHGMVVDFSKIDLYVEGHVEHLDHQNLNAKLDFHTTSENLAKYFHGLVSERQLPRCAWVSVSETPSTKAVYYPK